jgi:hypothetical protein
MTRRGDAVLIMTLLIVLLGSALTGCTRSPAPPQLPPTGVYAHEPSREVSFARTAPTQGGAGRLISPLIADGWFCAEARRNSLGRSLWCRTSWQAEDELRRSQVAQFVLDHDDQLAWAWFPHPSYSLSTADHDLIIKAAASLDQVWPDAAGRIGEQIEDHVEDSEDQTVSDGVPRSHWRDRHATYSYSDIDGLVVVARNTSVAQWPYASEHYAQTMSSAVDDLAAGGYQCHYPPQQICNNPGANRDFQVTLRADQIVSASFSLPSRVESGRQVLPLTDFFPNGLSFLTDTVRLEITNQIEESRRTGSSFAGIVEGAVLIIDSDVGYRRGDELAAGLEIQVGAPLAGTLPI